MKKVIFALMVSVFCLSVNAQEKEEIKYPLSSSLKVGELLFISGQVGTDPVTSELSNASFEAELRQVMENLKSELKEHNLTLDDLVSVTIYLKDMNDYDQLNEVYGTYFKNRFPTRTCIAVADLPVKATVEISGIAHFQPKK